jgi:hypothetical protein
MSLIRNRSITKDSITDFAIMETERTCWEVLHLFPIAEFGLRIKRAEDRYFFL